jgi:hypothetical protein
LDIDHENDAAKTEMTNIDNQLAKIASDKISELITRAELCLTKATMKIL